MWSFQSLSLAIHNRRPEPNRHGSPWELTQQTIVHGNEVTAGFFRQGCVSCVCRFQTLAEQTHRAPLGLIQIDFDICPDFCNQRLHVLASCQVGVGRNLGTVRRRYDQKLYCRKVRLASNRDASHETSVARRSGHPPYFALTRSRHLLTALRWGSAILIDIRPQPALDPPPVPAYHAGHNTAYPGRSTMPLQHEITAPSPLLDAHGRLAQAGWAREPLLDCNLEHVALLPGAAALPPAHSGQTLGLLRRHDARPLLLRHPGRPGLRGPGVRLHRGLRHRRAITRRR